MRDFKEKILSSKQLDEVLVRAREEKKTIVSINGSFDLLHAGHLTILFEAKAQGDLLIAALNSDESIKQYKGENRPIIPLKFRLEMMAALSCVDYVTWFNEADPIALLSQIRPHVHVNGSEYGQDCLESSIVKKNGGRLHIVERVPGLSTSEVIENAASSLLK
ncbi:MAG: adenylyltransferase/cytidyltransferase family protein [Simkaniaceae bacterium]